MLIKSVEETGVTTREIRELEDQLDTESKKNMEETLDKITTDYQEMRKDNVALLQRLKHQGTS
jgi:DNA-binding transcriptional MerR regulator